MKVSELIEYLQGYDEDANVYIMSQPTYPIESSIADVVERRDYQEKNDQEPGCSSNDVILIEGSNQRYGDKAAWSCVF